MSDNLNNGFPSHMKRMRLHPQDFTMLGNELPNANGPETPLSQRRSQSSTSETT